MKNRNILISGASVAGPSLAFWLSRFGFQPTVVESAPAVRPGGYAVDFRGAAMRVLERMGILHEIRRFETRTGAITMVDKTGRKIASMPDGFTSGELEIMRGDLADVLYRATRNDAEYIFDDSIAAMQENSGGVEVTFSHGATRTFDLVVGADGLHSNVRTLVFGPEERFVHDLGCYVSIFTTPNFLNLDMSGVYYGALGRKIGVFSARGNTEARASFYFASERLPYDHRDTAQQKRILRERFADEEWEARQLLKMMDDAPDFYFDSISQIRMEKWSAGRCVLLGDAGYCPSPMSGMGTSMAAVGAYVLAGELKDANGDYAAAFARYETRMRDYVTRCQKLAGGLDWFIPRTRWKLWLSRQVWRMLPYTPWKNMMIELPMKAANSIRLENW